MRAAPDQWAATFCTIPTHRCPIVGSHRSRLRRFVGHLKALPYGFQATYESSKAASDGPRYGTSLFWKSALCKIFDGQYKIAPFQRRDALQQAQFEAVCDDSRVICGRFHMPCKRPENRRKRLRMDQDMRHPCFGKLQTTRWTIHNCRWTKLRHRYQTRATAVPAPSNGEKRTFWGLSKVLRSTERFKNDPSSKTVEPLDGTAFLHFWFAAFHGRCAWQLLECLLQQKMRFPVHSDPCKDGHDHLISKPCRCTCQANLP